jgi:hypothetical protein
MGSSAILAISEKGSNITRTLETTAAGAGLAANPARKEMRIKNMGTATLYVSRGAGCTSAAGDYEWDLPGGMEADDGTGGERIIRDWVGAVSVASTGIRFVLSVITLLVFLLVWSSQAQQVTIVQPATRPVPVGAVDVICTNTITVASLTTPTAGYVIGTNAMQFLEAGGKGMLQAIMVEAHTNAPLVMHIFRRYQGVATPGAAYDYDILNRGHTRACPPIDLSSWTALGTAGASGESFCASVYGLNIPVSSGDGNLFVILVAGATPKAQAGWANSGTAPIIVQMLGVRDPKNSL